MTYVYILQSLEIPEHYYIGVTHDLRARLQKHNAGGVSHTSKFTPWTIKTYVAFSDEKQAVAFEKYLKSPSGVWRRRGLVGRVCDQTQKTPTRQIGSPT